MVVDRSPSSQIAHRIVWCTVATVDRRNRPRSRILHPFWEHTEDGLVGWITTRPTPLKLAHLDHSPYVSCCTGTPRTTSRSPSAGAEWVDDVDTQAHAWELFRAAPEPLGHDPYTIWPEGRRPRRRRAAAHAVADAGGGDGDPARPAPALRRSRRVSYQLVQIAGSLLILAAFAASQAAGCRSTASSTWS